MSRSTTLSAACALLLGGSALVFAAPIPAFYDLGPGTGYGISADGSAATGFNTSGTYFRWTRTGGTVVIGGSHNAGSPKISEDGMWIGASDLNPTDNLREMAKYDVAAGTWTRYGGIGGSSGTNRSNGWGITGDGQKVVGLGWVTAGRAEAVESQGTGMISLGSTVPGRSSRANAADYDGDVVVGWQDSATGFRQGAYWVNGVQTLLVDNDSNPMGEIGDVSADGNWMVGSGQATGAQWRYDRSTNTTLYLGTIPGTNLFRSSTSVSDDGKTIVGFQRGSGPAVGGQGTIWFEGDGMYNLTQFAQAIGVPVPSGVTLALPLGISADGYHIVGLSSQNRAFVISIPEPGTAGAAFAALSLLMARRRRKF